MNITAVFRTFAQAERVGGAWLVAGAIASLSIANSAWGEAWIAFWRTPAGPLTLQAWVNDALMALVFLLIGLELEREIYVGELSDFGAALLPIVAALGGVLVPTAIHFALNHDSPTQAGAAIPMATDIAFALAAIGLLGDRVPLSLKVFLTALAVIDDLAAVLVIAIAYGSGLDPGYLALAGVIFTTLVAMNRARVLAVAPYLIGGAVLWFSVLRAGVHPTFAGVLLAFAIPFEPRTPIERSPSHRLETILHKPVAFIVLPLFALANAGVVVSGSWAELFDANGVGIALGLIAGKPIGITLACVVAVAMGLRRPRDLTWPNIVGAGMLGGIGFTMSIFITQLAFPSPDPHGSTSTLAVMIASLVSGMGGILWLAATSSRAYDSSA